MPYPIKTARQRQEIPMIGDPPVLTMRRNFKRPDKKVVAAFAGVPTGFVVDAMGGRGALHYRIKSVVPVKGVMVGVALTSENGPADNLGLFGSLSIAEPGDVLVASTEGFMVTAITGDLLLGMAKNKGVIGFVTDGAVRDLAGILDVGLPTYCTGITPNSPVKNGPGSIGLPVVVGGVTVESGDIVIGDQDGVVIVPRGRAEEVLASLEGVRAAEAKMDAAVKAGMLLPDSIKAILASGRVHEID
jgi:4-hydroxy-4-methyl-2-oxoglutarate aldolase